jgi:RimJ/RimL family protein N-acetyltransferase
VHDIPELVTPRLRLRGFEPRDFGAYATMMAEPEVTRYLGDGKPLTRVDAWRQFWGNGYAREGARAALDYARETLGRTEVVSLIRPGNAGSIRVAESLGATLSGEIEFFGGPTLIYRYPPTREQRL